MSETKFTPGPWKISNGNMANVIEAATGRAPRDEYDDGCAAVASVQACCASYRHDDRDANCTANMHLIAASPDLYAALDNLRQRTMPDKSPCFCVFGRPNDEHEKWCTAARSALSRARGET